MKDNEKPNKDMIAKKIQDEEQIDQEIMHIYRVMNSMFDIEPDTIYKEFAEDRAVPNKRKHKTK